MALSRIRCSRDLPTVLSRAAHPVTGTLGESHSIRHGLETVKPAKTRAKAGFHFSGVRRYPEAPKLPLPSNVSEIFGNETGRFTPERSRDIAAPVLAYVTSQGSRDGQTKKTFDANCANWGPARASCGDTHVDSYDCFGAVSLNSSMQSNVPLPFCSSGKASHFNMPGGQWAENNKYIAENMQNNHYKIVKIRELKKKNREIGPLTNAVFMSLTPMPNLRNESRVAFSTDASAPAKETEKIGSVNANSNTSAAVPLSNKEKLKKAVKDYGGTVIVFHVGISLISLGVCYVAVSSGLDVVSLVKLWGTSERFEKAMAGSSTFLIAYAVHKVFAPVRISITLGATPFIVKYLRNVGILKKPKT